MSTAFSQTINRYGSTSANFLEIGVGSANTAMGDAGVTFAQGPSSVYWNPAALAFVIKYETSFMLQPWILDINMMYFGASIYLNRIGTLALSITQMGYGEFFTHGTGHGLGLEIHTSPRFSPQSDQILSENNVMTIEPGIYLAGWGGVRIEDDVIIKDNNCEILNKTTKDLVETN